MKKAIFFIIALILCNAIYCQLTYDWNWASSSGGSSGDSGKAIATDNEGNVFVTGMYQRTAYFGSITLTDDGSFPYEPNIFVAKMDSLGNWLWAKKVLCPNYHSLWVEDISVDVNGNCIIVGQYTAGSFVSGIVSNGGMDGFIAKLDTYGNWLWAKSFGGADYDAAHGVSCDSDGNIYVTGNFSGTVIVDTTLLISGGSNDIFVVKMDSNGNWVWAKRAGGTEWDYGYGITTDSFGNSYVTGSCRQTANFGATNISNYGNDDIFVAKIDSSGNWLWANGAGGINGDEGTSITCDSLGNVYLTGMIGSIATFGSTTLQFYGNRDVFIAKLNANGIWQWALQAGSIDGDEVSGIDINNDGNIFVAGHYQGILHYGTSTITAIGSIDLFFALLDCNGNWLYMKQVGSVNNEDVFGLAIDNNSGLVVTGRFSNSMSFGANNLVSNGNDDIFVARLSQKSPTVSFSSNLTGGLEPLQVQFTDNSFAGWGAMTNWYWDFGDGTSSTAQNPLHLYEYEGVYSVSLVVTNTFSLSDTLLISDFINVLPRNPEIAFTPSSAMDFGIVNLTTQSVMDLWIRNIGTATIYLNSLAFFQSETLFDVVGLTLPIEIAEGDSLAIQIGFTPLVAGTVTDSLFIYNNSINLPRAAIRLSGTGQFIPPLPPENIFLMMDGSNAVISWEPVTETEMNTPMVPDYYLVFSCPSDPQGVFGFLGTTPNLQFTHHLVGLHSPNMFYRVRAYKYYGRGGDDFASLGLVPGMSEDEVLEKLNVRR